MDSCTDLAAMLQHEALALHEEAAGAAAGVVHAALEGLEHFDDQADDALGRVELAAALAGGNRELAEEVFVDVAEDVLGVQAFVAEWHGGQEVDQARQGLVDAPAGVAFVEHVLELGVFLLDGFEGIVEQAADAGELVFAGLAVLHFELGADGDLGAGLEEVPTGQGRHPEDVLFGVVVAGFEFLFDQLGAVCTEVVVVGWVGEGGLEFFTPLAERVGDVFKENQAEDNVHVVAGVEVGAQLVGGCPEALVELVEELLLGVVHGDRSKQKARWLALPGIDAMPFK
jgi:hypothetical protein